MVCLHNKRARTFSEFAVDLAVPVWVLSRVAFLSTSPSASTNVLDSFDVTFGSSDSLHLPKLD